MKLAYKIYLSFLLIGVVLTFFAFVGFLNPIILLLFFAIILFLFFLLCSDFFIKISDLNKNELFFSYLFVVIWSLHFLQILIPETGFDALWYHLPIAKSMIQNQGLVFLPKLYQSINPQFADLYFISGFSVLGSLGSKIIAYIFGLLFVLSSYNLSRLFLSRKFSIITAVIISTFQVVAWQSSSFYVDVAKGFFEISGLLFLLSNFENNLKNKKYSLLFFAASLSTKLFSILLVPVFVFIYGFKNFFSKKLVLNLFLLFSIPTLYYYFSYVNTSNPFYSLSVHIKKLAEIGGQQSLFSYIFYKTISLPKSLLSFSFARDYVAPFIIVSLIPIFQNIKYILKNKKLKALFVFSLAQWMIWWFVPPLSTRYTLSGFVTLLILGLTIFLKQNSNYKQQLTISLLIYILLAFIPRVIIAKRSLKYILTPQTQQQYLEQFYDGSIDEKINDWYNY